MSGNRYLQLFSFGLILTDTQQCPGTVQQLLLNLWKQTDGALIMGNPLTTSTLVYLINIHIIVHWVRNGWGSLLVQTVEC